MSTMHPTDINAALVNLARKRTPERWQTVPIGLTPLLRPMLALVDTRSLPFSGEDHRPTVLLIAGLRGETMDTPRVLVALDQFARSASAGASGCRAQRPRGQQPRCPGRRRLGTHCRKPNRPHPGLPARRRISTPTKLARKADTCGAGFATRPRI